MPTACGRMSGPTTRPFEASCPSFQACIVCCITASRHFSGGKASHLAAGICGSCFLPRDFGIFLVFYCNMYLTAFGSACHAKHGLIILARGLNTSQSSYNDDGKKQKASNRSMAAQEEEPMMHWSDGQLRAIQAVL